ncbi:hypothetical protein JCM5296_005981 [Sporobolomyces johnsonii]
MLDFPRFRSASVDERSSLSPLPPKLAGTLRSSPPSSSQSSPEGSISTASRLPPSSSLFSAPDSRRRDSGASDATSTWSGPSFAELLSRDVRQSVVIHGEEDLIIEEQEAGGDGRAEGRREVQRREDVLALPGGDWGVTGPDARLFVQELHRARVATAQKRRRRTGYLAGVLSIIVLGITTWYEVEVCWALAEKGGKGRVVLRWVEFGLLLGTVGLWLVVLAFLRTRRPSTLAVSGLASAGLSVFIHVSLALTNLILSFVWRDELGQRCTWGLDVAWTIGEEGELCEGRSWAGWSISAGVRLVVTTVVAAAWIASLRAYNHTLHIPFIISPDTLPSSEVQALLSKHRAEIIPLPSSYLQSADHPSHHPDWLPNMPDRAHYAQVSDHSATYSYISSHMRSSSGAAGRTEASRPSNRGIGTWIGAKLWGGVGWLLGVQPYEVPPGQALADVETNHGYEEQKATLRPQPRAGQDNHSIPDMRQLSNLGRSTSPSLEGRIYQQRDLDDPLFDVEYDERRRSYVSRTSFTASEDSYRGLFDHLEPPTHASAPSIAPLLSSARPLPTPIEEPTDTDEPPLPAPPPPPKDPRTVSGTGSSGSTGGNLVFVRMSDGRLVRRLSTIASLSVSEGGESSSQSTRRSRSDLSGSGSTGESGGESFATAPTGGSGGFSRGEAKQEVLTLDNGSVVEDWRRRSIVGD